jgi:pimeloyl-ACP methyl ester carboxylesterase
MNTDTLSIGGLEIFYRRSGDSGTPVVFIHGNSFSSRAFSKQLDSALAEDYRLFTFDLPGHGESSDASDPSRSYSLRGFARTCIEFVSRLGIEDGFFVGWSLGGHVLFEASDRLKSARGFMIFGTPPLGASDSPHPPFHLHPAATLTLKRELSEEERETFVDALFRPGFDKNKEIFMEDLMRTDNRVRKVLADSADRGEFRDEVEIVKNLDKPLGVMQGAKDQLVNGDYLADLEYGSLFENRIIPVPGAGHTPQWENPETFNCILRRFIGETHVV